MIRNRTELRSHRAPWLSAPRLAASPVAAGLVLFLLLPASPGRGDTVVFQQGATYTGTQDAHIHTAYPDTNYGNTENVKWDSDDNGGVMHGLLRFDALFAPAGPIPAGAVITSATLTIELFNESVNPATPGYINVCTVDWNEATVTSNNFGGDAGVQADEYGALVASTPTTPVGTYNIDVTSSVQAWLSDPNSNYGWIFRPNSTDGAEIRSSEYAADPGKRPKLTVVFTAPCNGPEDCDDGNPCTDDTCDTGTGACVFTPDNTNTCSDGIDCTTDACVNGSCVGTDNCADGEFCDTTPPPGACVQVPRLPILAGSIWSYLDNGSDQGTAWKEPSFDDSAWASGAAQLGYGDGDETTTVYCGPSSPTCTSGNYITTYFRRAFWVDDVSNVYALNLSLLRDDGAVVYLNGTEIWRTNMPTGTISYTTVASSAISGTDETTFVSPSTPPSPALLVNGRNVIAVEIHQQSATSSDISFDLTLSATAPPDPAPQQPTAPSPDPNAIGVSTNPQLCVTATDGAGDNDPLTVTFYGRQATGAPGNPFTIIVLPDPQYYAASYPATYTAQTQWIRDNAAALNIAFVTCLGDMTDNASTAQWTVADAALDILEPPLPGMPDGIPYGIAVGNHDQNPSGSARSGTDEGATTTEYNAWFGKARFQARGYFGGNYTFGGTYPNSMDNHYELFSASGMDFIIFHLEVDGMGTGYEGTCSSQTCADVIAWMDDILTNVYPNRRAIIVSHAILQPSGNPPAFMSHGTAIYAAIQDNPNVFLMMCGHLDQANHRVDMNTVGGQPHTVYTLISDYQSRPNGGNGWLRILTFDPLSDTIHVETYSPTLGRYINKPTAHADNAPNDACARDCYTDGTFTAGGNELMLPYDMDAGQPWQQIGTPQVVASGGRACANWPGRLMGTEYEWYVTISDGTTTTTGPTWSFTTGTTCDEDGDCDDGNECTLDTCNDVTHECEHTPRSGACTDDGNPCTDDVCDDGACTHPADNSNTCSDGNGCTTDTCVAGVCESTYAPSPGCCDADTDCDDGDPGTTDTCEGEPNGSCTNVLNEYCVTDAECNDNNACTTDDCMGGNAAAVELNGSTQYINLGNDNNTAAVNYLTNFGTSSFTIEGWFRADSASTYMGLFRQGSQNAYPQVVVQFPGSSPYNRIAGSVETSTSGTQVDVTVSQQFTLGVWYHYAMVANRDPNAQTLTVYLHDASGALVGSAQATANVWGTNPVNDTYTGTPPNETRDPVVLGVARTPSPGPNYNYYFDGALDDVRIWDHARTLQQIADNLYQPLSTAGLRHHWELNEGTGTTTVDSGTTPTTPGTLVNAPIWLTSGLPDLGEGICQHTPIPGCTPCTTADQCDDSDACTTDTCVAGRCEHAAVVCNDNNVCTDDTCNPASGCEYTNNNAPCDDGNACTSDDTCAGGTCVGTPIAECCDSDDDCDDGNPCTADSCPSANVAAISLDGVNDYVDFGAASTHTELGLARFTIECWFKKTGDGNDTAFMASAPNNAVPLVTKGRGVGDGGTFDLNYFLGIVKITNTLVFSFEQIEAPAGADNVVQGTRNINDGAWHHAAVTYDGAMLRLFTDGTPDGTPLATTTTPRWDSIHRFAIGTGYSDYTSPGPSGYFAGYIDEVRVWDHARTQAEIAATMNQSLLSGAGLVGRWGMDEGSGTAVADSTTPASNGTRTNGQAWISADLPDFGDGGSCQHTPVANGTSCSDGAYCNGAETCQGGTCTSGTPPCDDLHCDETNDACWACISASECDDSNACTTDACVDHACTHTPITGCCNTAAECDDGNPCTDNDCVAHACVYTNDDTNVCDDGDPCTTNDACSAGVCEGDPLCDDGDACTVDACVADANTYALDFDGTNDYVTMGVAAGETALGARAFTLEAWIRRDGATWGVTTNTGTGGVDGVPLITKGRGESEADTLNCNYFLGITPSGTPVADFEQKAAAGGWAIGQNHPICGTIAIVDQGWHHVAVTYSIADGWRMYVDGVEGTTPDGTSCASCSPAGSCPRSPGVEPEYASIQHFGLGTAMTSGGAPAGYFAGMMDEARVWNYARSGAQIRETMYVQMPSAPGLIGRWGLNEGTGTVAADSTLPAQNGTLTNGPVWVTSKPSLFECQHTPITGCCNTAAECDDGDACTTDTCVDHACNHTPIPDCCDADADCDDGHDCTTGTCNTANVAALQFTGSSSQYANLGNDGGASGINFLTNFGTNSFTVEGWMWAASAGSDYTCLFRHGRQGDNAQVVVQWLSGGLSASVEPSGTGNSTQVTTAGIAVSFNAWHHFAAVIERPTGGTQWLRLYIDGVLRDSKDATALWSTTPINNTGGGADAVLLAVARNASGGLVNYYTGRLDEIRIWDHARTAQQIVANMNRQVESAPGLRHRWAMNEGSGTSIADTGATPTTAGTLVNGPTWLTAAQSPTFGDNRCTYTLDAGYCLIDDACHLHDAADPNNPCQYCNATTNPNQWSSRAAGTACGDASDTDCTDPDTCDGNGHCQENHAADGTSCSDGLYCNGADTCSAGVCDQHAGNPCQAGQTCDENNDVCLSGNEAAISLVVPGAPQSGPQGTIYTADVIVSDLNVAINGAQVAVHFDHTQLGFVEFAPNTGGGWTSPTISTDPNHPNDLVVGAVTNGSWVGPGGPFTVGTLSFRGLLPGSAAVVGIAAAAPWDPGMTTNLTRYPTTVTFPPTSTTDTTPGDIVILACDDGNPCTDDDFDGTTCVFTNDDTNTCSDNNACTQIDACVDGACVGGNPVVCDDGNACTDDVCNPSDGLCSFIPDDNNACDDGAWCTVNDRCVSGACTGESRDCRDAQSCTTDSCDEANDRCLNTLDAGYCLIAGTCVSAWSINTQNECQWCDPDVDPNDWTNRPAGSACGSQTTTDCDAPDACDGAGVCLANYAPAGTPCNGSPLGACDQQDVCSDVGECLDMPVKPAGTPCRPSAGPCDAAETCDGSGVDCPADTFEPDTTVCRAAVGPCDVSEFCTGTGASCPNDAKAPAGTECRAAAGVCDIAELCDGSTDDCPADTVEPATTECRAAAGDCDLAEFCDGSSAACPNDELKPAGALCRAAADQCDAAEYCDGTAATCPDDIDKPDGTACDDGLYCTVDDVCHNGECEGTQRDCVDAFDCTVDSCDESTDRCVNDPDAGHCLIDDACVLAGALRPGFDCQWCDPSTDSRAWTNRPAGSACGGPPSGACDVQDTCDNGVCVASYAPIGTLCRDAVGECDVPEYCTGNAAGCPADQFKNVDTLCRPAADQCDAAEYCDGASAFCPADGSMEDGTACDDGLFCTVNDACTAGQCLGVLRDCGDGNNCTTDACDEDADACINVDTTQIVVNVEVEGLLVPPVVSPARTRTVTFVTTDCQLQHRETHIVPVTFSTNPVMVILSEVDPAADWIEIVEGHTLARTLAVAYLPCTATINATGGNRLLSGDFSNPPWVTQTNRIDIQDFAILAVYWNQPVDANLGYRADANGDGMQDVGDFTAIQANFGIVGNPIDRCVTLAGGGPPTPWGIEPPQDNLILPLSEDDGLRVAAASLGLPHIERADCNGDGWVDLRDVRLFARQRGLPLLPAFAALIDQYEASYVPVETDAGALSDD